MLAGGQVCCPSRCGAFLDIPTPPSLCLHRGCPAAAQPGAFQQGTSIMNHTVDCSLASRAAGCILTKLRKPALCTCAATAGYRAGRSHPHILPTPASTSPILTSGRLTCRMTCIARSKVVPSIAKHSSPNTQPTLRVQACCQALGDKQLCRIELALCSEQPHQVTNDERRHHNHRDTTPLHTRALLVINHRAIRRL